MFFDNNTLERMTSGPSYGLFSQTALREYKTAYTLLDITFGLFCHEKTNFMDRIFDFWKIFTFIESGIFVFFRLVTSWFSLMWFLKFSLDKMILTHSFGLFLGCFIGKNRQNSGILTGHFLLLTPQKKQIANNFKQKSPAYHWPSSETSEIKITLKNPCLF